MRRQVGLLVLALALAACSRTHSRLGAATPLAAASPAPQATLAAVTGSAAAGAATELPAEAAQPATGTDEDEPGTTSLERIAELPRDQQLPSGRWKPGVNYDPVVPAQPTSSPAGKVEVMEVFWLACPHCYALEPSVLAWLKEKPAYANFVRIPVMWGPPHRAHARLFFTLEALGRNDLVEKAFDTLHAEEMNAPREQRQPDLLFGSTEEDTFARQQAFAKANGVDPDAFAKAYNSAEVAAQLKHAEEVTQRYHVDGVPFIVVDGKYTTDVEKAGGPTQLFELIDSLAGFEHRRDHGA